MRNPAAMLPRRRLTRARVPRRRACRRLLDFLEYLEACIDRLDRQQRLRNADLLRKRLSAMREEYVILSELFNKFKALWGVAETWATCVDERFPPAKRTEGVGQSKALAWLLFTLLRSQPGAPKDIAQSWMLMLGSLLFVLRRTRWWATAGAAPSGLASNVATSLVARLQARTTADHTQLLVAERDVQREVHKLWSGGCIPGSVVFSPHIADPTHEAVYVGIGCDSNCRPDRVAFDNTALNANVASTINQLDERCVRARRPARARGPAGP